MRPMEVDNDGAGNKMTAGEECHWFTTTPGVSGEERPRLTRRQEAARGIPKEGTND